MGFDTVIFKLSGLLVFGRFSSLRLSLFPHHPLLSTAFDNDSLYYHLASLLHSHSLVPAVALCMIEILRAVMFVLGMGIGTGLGLGFGSSWTVILEINGEGL